MFGPRSSSTNPPLPSSSSRAIGASPAKKRAPSAGLTKSSSTTTTTTATKPSTIIKPKVVPSGSSRVTASSISSKPPSRSASDPTSELSLQNLSISSGKKSARLTSHRPDLIQTEPTPIESTPIVREFGALSPLRRTLNPNWYTGPLDPNGRVFDSSDRNLLCMSVEGNLCVVGSADHGLQEYNIEKGVLTRTLYNKKYGHTEWVVTVSHIRDGTGRCVSGGMDSKLCLWDSKIVRCQDLLGHTMSVSVVKARSDGIIVSGSYDKTLRIWESRSGREVGVLKGHEAPVLDFVYTNNCIVSGDREGTVKIWDTHRGDCLRTIRRHKGQISALCGCEDEGLVLTGGQDGVLNIIDLRTFDIESRVLHRSERGVGALTNIVYSLPVQTIVTAGADKKMQIIDPRSGFNVRKTLTDHTDFIYAMISHQELVISGSGNGKLIVHDLGSDSLLYDLMTGKNAMRCLWADESRLVCAGDEGNCIVYNY